MTEKKKIRNNHKFRLTTSDFNLIKSYVRYFYEEEEYYNYQLDDEIWVYAEKSDVDNVQFLMGEDHYLGFEGSALASKEGLWRSKMLRHNGICELSFDEYVSFRLKESLTKFLDED